jgi:hypothetical protein
MVLERMRIDPICLERIDWVLDLSAVCRVFTSCGNLVCRPDCTVLVKCSYKVEQDNGTPSIACSTNKASGRTLAGSRPWCTPYLGGTSDQALEVMMDDGLVTIGGCGGGRKDQSIFILNFTFSPRSRLAPFRLPHRYLHFQFRITMSHP